MADNKKNQKIIDYYDYLANAASTQDCTCLLYTSSLIYARVVHPCSKLKTYIEILPKLFEAYDFSLDKLYSVLGYIGSKYEKIIDVYKRQPQTAVTVTTVH